MNKALIIALICALPFTGFSQSIDVNKDNGLVSVNGKGVFYMISKNKVMWEADYVLTNLDNKELAYFKLTKKIVYDEHLKNHNEIQYYVLTFDQPGDHCDIKDYMDDTTTIVKALAKEIVSGNLVQGNEINKEKEEEFVIKHDGKIKLQEHKTPDTRILINIKDNKIYNNGDLIGTYKKLPIDEMIALQVYNTSQNKVAEVTHEENGASWTIITPVDQKKDYLDYDKSSPMESLFKYLVEKKYL